jgi:hypothetical protein
MAKKVLDNVEKFNDTDFEDFVRQMALESIDYGNR